MRARNGFASFGHHQPQTPVRFIALAVSMSSIQRDDHLKTDGPAVVATSSAVVVRAARRLPNELLLHIAGFTDRATSIRLRRVSKGFNAIIDTIRWTWLSFRTQVSLPLPRRRVPAQLGDS